MKYVKFEVKYKNGDIEVYSIEIEPNEVEEMKESLQEVVSTIDTSMTRGVSACITVPHTDGFVLIRLDDVMRVNTIGYAELLDDE